MAASTSVDIDRVVAHGIELESGSLKPTRYHSEFHSVCARKGQSGHHGHAVVRGAAPTSRATAPYTAHFMAHRMYGSSQQMRHGTPCVDLAMIRPICDVVHLCANPGGRPLRNRHGGARPPFDFKKGGLSYAIIASLCTTMQGAIVTYSKSCVKSRPQIQLCTQNALGNEV